MIAALFLCLLSPAGSAQASEDAAQKALTAGNKLEALEHLEAALRAAEETSTKARLRDAYRAVGWVSPRGITIKESRTYANHIRDEKLRIWGAAADRLRGEGMPYAALILRRAIIEEVGPKHKRAKQERERIKRAIRTLTENPNAEEKELADSLLRTKRDGRKLLKAARKLLESRRYRVVVRISQQIMFGSFDQEIQNEAIALRKEAERGAATAVTEEEKRAAREVLEDARFHRLEVVPSRHFLFVGPREFVEAITPRDKTLLDLAYIFQTDLAAQQPNLDGARLCVYYQETFDFGGGLAGGKLIRIGNRAIRAPIAGMLHYHELGHCIFGRGWLHQGFTEGLADFAAGFSLDALGQTASAQRFITEARDKFVRYFLGRDVRYFRIQPYRPSAGFLFSFLPPGEAPFDWAPYRRVFNRMREAQFGSWPERDHQIMRFFGYLLATEYGPRVFGTLTDWGWPVDRGDTSRVPEEARSLLSDVKQGEHYLRGGSPESAADYFRGVLDVRKSGSVANRARFGLLRVALSRGDAATASDLKRTLGILDAFLVCGPFHAYKRTAHAVFTPETDDRIDLSKQVGQGSSSGIWKPAKVQPTGSVDLRKQGYGYPDNACAFALTYLYADAATPARVWVGSDDGHTLYVNGRLVEKRATSRALRFDDDFADVELRSGWNRLLLKVHNSNGAWGFLMRVTARDGEPLTGVRASIEDHERQLRVSRPTRFKSIVVVNEGFKSFSSSRWRTTVGGFDTQNGALRPKGTAKSGLWQRFKVDPDKPKDGPANIAWLTAPGQAECDSFEMELTVAGVKGGLPAKFGFTIDGENENDGQSGHTFVLDQDKGRLRCLWYRYDRLLFLQPGVKLEPAPTYRLVLRRVDGKWWLSVNDVALFQNVDAPRLPAFGFGLLTWGKGPMIESFKLTRLEARN